eukprot:jgi/Chrpa1/17614/Chrysochromulina_OHIO_Genome00023742-RA
MALEAEGAVGVAEAADEIAQGKLRLACGKALLKLLRVCPYRVENTLGAPGVHKLALLMHDGIPQVRAAFGKKLAAEAMRGFQTDKKETKLGAPARYLSTRTKNLPPQYITWLALAAVDPLPGLQQFARERLVHLAAVWRSSAERQENPRGLPETQLPWLVHVLAHHPDFEMEERALDAEEDEKGEGSVRGTMPTAQRCLDFYINGCLAKSVTSFDLLREVCAKVRTAVDRLEPNGPQTRMVAAIARALIDFRAERSRNAMVSPVRPQLGLPSLLFVQPSEGHPLHADADHLPLGSAFQFIDDLKDAPKQDETTKEAVAGDAAATQAESEEEESQVFGPYNMMPTRSPYEALLRPVAEQEAHGFQETGSADGTRHKRAREDEAAPFPRGYCPWGSNHEILAPSAPSAPSVLSMALSMDVDNEEAGTPKGEAAAAVPEAAKPVLHAVNSLDLTEEGAAAPLSAAQAEQVVSAMDAMRRAKTTATAVVQGWHLTYTMRPRGGQGDMLAVSSRGDAARIVSMVKLRKHLGMQPLQPPQPPPPPTPTPSPQPPQPPRVTSVGSTRQDPDTVARICELGLAQVSVTEIEKRLHGEGHKTSSGTRWPAKNDGRVVVRILLNSGIDPCPLSASLHASVGSVAFLWGARKATDSPMSIDLIVDHITEGDRTNYAVDNLQFLTLAENVRKWHRHRRGVGGANEQHE